MTRAPEQPIVPEPKRAALAIILARAGSKGVPGKNSASVAGRPCVEWTIEAALGASRVARVAVSTDDPAVQEIARKLGAEIVDRPHPLAADHAPVDDALRHAVETLDQRPTRAGAPAGAPPDSIVMLYASVPVRPRDLIDRAIDLLMSTDADSVQSYAPVGKHHPWWTCRVNPETGEVRPWEGDALFHNTFRRQDLPPAHIPDGGVTVVARRALFRRGGERGAGTQPGPHAFLGRPSHRRGILTGEGDVIDIDSPIDLIVADAVLRGTQPTRN